MQFNNEKFNISAVKQDDLFICAIGYEKRSTYIYEKLKAKIKGENIMLLFFDDYQKNLDSNREIIDLMESDKLQKLFFKYEEGNEVQSAIISFVEKKKSINCNIHLDYSSMPRKWYYKLPFELKNVCKNSNNIYFWYSTGKYEPDYECYPSAGVESYSIIGKTSLRIDPKRLHVFGLSYDSIRTKALISILDPDAYITCNAYNGARQDIGINVRKKNKEIIEQGGNEVTLEIDDFSFMVAKLCEIVNEYLPLGDVILVPDGPKPLIFAMALVPQVLQKEGVTCILVSRNQKAYEPIKVSADGYIYGFSILAKKINC